MAQKALPQPPQLAFFDHVYAVVDAITAAEVARSPYLHDFGRFKVATTTADGRTWTGRYLFGRRTYVEIFGPTDLQGVDEAEGSSGIGLSTHHRGDIARLAARVEDQNGIVELGQTNRQEGDREIPWFDQLSPSETAREMEIWVMEFLGDPSDLELRAAAFDTWSEVRDEAQSGQRHPSLGEVCSVELATSTSDIDAAEPLLRAAGFVVSRLEDVCTASDSHMTITLDGRPAAAPGLTRIGFTLDSPAAAVHVETLGRSTLTVGPGSRAAWDFGGPSTTA